MPIGPCYGILEPLPGALGRASRKCHNRLERASTSRRTPTSYMFSEIRYGAAGVADEEEILGGSRVPRTILGPSKRRWTPTVLRERNRPDSRNASSTPVGQPASSVRRRQHPSCQTRFERPVRRVSVLRLHLHPQRCCFLDADEGALRACGLIILRNRDAARYALVLDVAAGVVLDGEVAFDTLHDNVSAAVF